MKTNGAEAPWRIYSLNQKATEVLVAGVELVQGTEHNIFKEQYQNKSDLHCSWTEPLL